MRQISRLDRKRSWRLFMQRWVSVLVLLALMVACGGNNTNPGGSVGSNQGNNWDVGRWDEARWQ